ncbi:hypothetical protein ES703_104271 [subsurface metagenome]
MERLLTAREVADHFRVSVQTIYFWMKKGYIKSSRVGGARRFKRSDLEAFFQSGSPTSADYRKKKATRLGHESE